MAGERAAERKANIRELGYRSVELVRHLGPALAEHRSSPVVRRLPRRDPGRRGPMVRTIEMK